MNLPPFAQISTTFGRNWVRDAKILAQVAIFGGKENMIGTTTGFDELMADLRLKVRRSTILTVIAARFGSLPADIVDSLKSIDDHEKLQQLVRFAARSATLDDFRRQMDPGCDIPCIVLDRK